MELREEIEEAIENNDKDELMKLYVNETRYFGLF